jgi:hypothetical protein
MDADLRDLDRLGLIVGTVVVLRLLYISATPPLSAFVPACIALGALPLIAAGRYAFRTRLDPAYATVLYTIGMVVLSFSGATTTSQLVFYSGRDFAMIDAMLDRADRWLGFDWFAYLAWFQRHPWLDPIVRFAYLSIFWQPLIVALVLAWRRVQRLCVFILAMVLALTVVCAIAMVLPCIGPYRFLNATTVNHQGLSLIMADAHVATLMWLRDASFHAPMPDSFFGGLISFPSYHASVAVLCIWACWRIPGINLAFLAINCLMLAATPTHGSHYLVDIIGGALIAGLSVAAARQLFRRR